MKRSTKQSGDTAMANAKAMFACAFGAAASILIIRTLSVSLSVLLVLCVLILSVLVLRHMTPLTEHRH